MIYLSQTVPSSTPPVSHYDLKENLIAFTAPKGERQARALLREWLRGHGWPTSTVNTLTKADFLSILAMNEEQGTPAPEQPKQPETRKPQTDLFGAPRHTYTNETKTEKETMTTPATNDQAAQLAALFAQIMSKPQFDEAEIVKLIKEHSNAPQVQRYELPSTEAVEIQGAHEKLPEIVEWLALGVPVYLVGAAGSGKSTIAAQAAKALGRDYYEYGALMTKYDVDNRTTLQGDTIESKFYHWYKNGGVLLLDEMDSSQAAALVQWNNAIRGGAGTLATFSNGETVAKHPEAIAIAAANTVGDGASGQYVGRSRLDKATLDGFAYVTMDYDPNVLETLSRGVSLWSDLCAAFRKAAAETKSQHIISPRANDFGSRLLSAKGDDAETVRRTVRAVIKKGLDADQWRNLCTVAARHAPQVNGLDLASL